MQLRSPQIEISKETSGSIAVPSQLKFSAQLEIPFALRIRVCNEDSYDESTNATIAPIAGKGDVIKTHSAGKDLEIHSDPDLDGEIWITLTNAVSEGVTVRIGVPELGNLILSYATTADVYHNVVSGETGEYVVSGSNANLVNYVYAS